MTSTEPSSPVISDNSRGGYSSSDMSASLISNEGINILPIAEELSKYFPKLDEDLNAVCTQISLDPLDSEVFETYENDKDSCLTPISFSSDFNTTGATKGSTIETDLGNDDDDEATLSIDNCPPLIIDDYIQKCPSPNPSISMTSSMTDLKSSTIMKQIKTSPRIRKQISLYENELVSATEFKSEQYSRRVSPRHYKFDIIQSTSLAQSTSNENIPYDKYTGTSKNANLKTKSCLNLKSCNITHHPGAILIKEKFIEPPKRITKSFHGKTGPNITDERSIDDESIRNSVAQKLRFITTKVEESENK